MKKAPIKAKNESNSPLFTNFLTQSGVFCNFFPCSTSYAKVSIIAKVICAAQTDLIYAFVFSTLDSDLIVIDENLFGDFDE